MELTLNCLDFNSTGERLAVDGNDAKVKIYDETTPMKDLIMTLKPNGRNLPGHTNRIFSLKFHHTDENILFSSGWDNTVQINDLRAGGPTAQIMGSHVCGDSVDVS